MGSTAWHSTSDYLVDRGGSTVLMVCRRCPQRFMSTDPQQALSMIVAHLMRVHPERRKQTMDRTRRRNGR
jgi:hypothetical protein